MWADFTSLLPGIIFFGGAAVVCRAPTPLQTAKALRLMLINACPPHDPRPSQLSAKSNFHNPPLNFQTKSRLYIFVICGVFFYLFVCLTLEETFTQSDKSV